MDFCFVYTNVFVQLWIAISLQKLQVFQLTAVKNITLCWVSIAVWQPKRNDSSKVETCVSLPEMYLRLVFEMYLRCVLETIVSLLEMYLRLVFEMYLRCVLETLVSLLEMYLRLVLLYVLEMYLRQVFLSVSVLEMYLSCFFMYLRCTCATCVLRCT